MQLESGKKLWARILREEAEIAADEANAAQKDAQAKAHREAAEAKEAEAYAAEERGDSLSEAMFNIAIQEAEKAEECEKYASAYRRRLEIISFPCILQTLGKLMTGMAFDTLADDPPVSYAEIEALRNKYKRRNKS